MSQTDTKCHWHLPADSKRTLPHHYAILPFTYTNTHAHAFTPKVFAAYHVFSDQLTLAGDRKPATKTEICGSQQRNQDCSLRAGNGKFRPLHIPVHLASGSTLKKIENMEGSVRAGKESAVDDESGSTQATCPSVCCTCCFRLRPELTHRLEQRGSLCFETAAVNIGVQQRHLGL